MKTLIILSLLILPFGIFGQSKSELNTRIIALESRVSILERELNQAVNEKNKLSINVDSLKLEIAQLRLNLSQKKDDSQINESSAVNANDGSKSSKNQCKAKTSSGKQCSRDAQEGSDYCWQHRPTYEPDSTKNSESSSGIKSGSSSGSSSGRTIHTGPRGGQYYINSNGKKTYIKKK